MMVKVMAVILYDHADDDCDGNADTNDGVDKTQQWRCSRRWVTVMTMMTAIAGDMIKTMPVILAMMKRRRRIAMICV